jgi:nitroimidazol reductase NimA-like FMN-containing flavoprotein (pyridoxamine 5'-phosphate oxidase superfamily)
MSAKQKGLDFITANKTLIINSIGLDGYPNTRVFYSHANDGFTVYFSSGKQTAKVAEIEKNPKVNAYYEDTSQDLGTWQNVTVYGKASILAEGSPEYEYAVKLIGVKNPIFKQRIAEGAFAERIIYKVTPEKVKVLDFSKDVKFETFGAEQRFRYGRQ